MQLLVIRKEIIKKQRPLKFLIKITEGKILAFKWNYLNRLQQRRTSYLDVEINEEFCK